MIYKAELQLSEPLLEENFKEAQMYLEDDDMTNYLPEELTDKITEIRWILEDESGGYYKIVSEDELTFLDFEKINEWISEQNLDGLGEGFSQQDFSELEDYSHVYIEDPEDWSIEENYDNIEYNDDSNDEDWIEF